MFSIGNMCLFYINDVEYKIFSARIVSNWVSEFQFRSRFKDLKTKKEFYLLHSNVCVYISPLVLFEKQ